MSNPKHCDKKTLKIAVDHFIDTCNIKVNNENTFTVKKQLKEITVALSKVSSQTITQELPQEAMAEFVNWGLLDKEFFGEEIPDGLERTLATHTHETIQADICKRYMSEEKENIMPEENETKVENLKKEIELLSAKHAKAVDKGKKKKADKFFILLESAKKELMDFKEQPKEEVTPEEEATPSRVEEIEAEIAALNKKLDAGMKKKKAKKANEKIAELAVELAELVKPKPTASSRGAAARAKRVIPDTISWPRAGSITATIIEHCQKKPRTIESIHNKLIKTFPDRPEAGMEKTIKALVGGTGIPLPIHYTKGITCEVENDGTPEKTIFVPIKQE